MITNLSFKRKASACYNGFAMAKRVIVLDYGAGNLRSVARAVEHAGFRPTSRPTRARSMTPTPSSCPASARPPTRCATSGRTASSSRCASTSRPAGRSWASAWATRRCSTVSEEGGEHPCLDIVPGRVRRLPSTNGGGTALKIPHMGWNSVEQAGEHPVFAGIPDGSYFYFVHSYYPDPEDDRSSSGGRSTA